MSEEPQIEVGAEAVALMPVDGSATKFPIKWATKWHPIWAIAACVFCAAMATTIWLRPQHEALLCRSLLKADADRICETLAAIGLHYRLGDNNSAIFVPKDQVHAARLEMAKAICSDEPMRFELVNFSATLSTASAAYTAALQNELEATIGAISGVELARVLIETPGNRGRLNGERPLAAVIISTAASAKLSSEQIRLIQNLVASSTDLLTPGEVTVSESQDSESLAEVRTQPL